MPATPINPLNHIHGPQVKNPLLTSFQWERRKPMGYYRQKIQCHHKITAWHNNRTFRFLVKPAWTTSVISLFVRELQGFFLGSVVPRCNALFGYFRNKASSLAGPEPNARLRRGALWAVLYDVIVLSQPCYDLFEKMAYMTQTTYCKRFDNSCYHCKLGLYEYQKTRRIIGIDLYVEDM